MTVKLNAGRVIALRREYDRAVKNNKTYGLRARLSKKYDISPDMVYQIGQRKAWAWVNEEGTNVNPKAVSHMNPSAKTCAYQIFGRLKDDTEEKKKILDTELPAIIKEGIKNAKRVLPVDVIVYLRQLYLDKYPIFIIAQHTGLDYHRVCRIVHYRVYKDVPMGARIRVDKYMRTTAATVNKIRRLFSEENVPQATLSRMFNIASSNINAIVHNRIFKWVTPDTPGHLTSPQNMKKIGKIARKKRREHMRKMQKRERIPDSWKRALEDSSIRLPDDCVRRLRVLREKHDWPMAEIARFFNIGYPRLVVLLKRKTYKHVV